jgi:predicted phosphodiesterase
MYTRIIGDAHGYKQEFIAVLNSMPEDVTSAIQVGDMAVGFGQSDYWHESLDAAMKASNARFIRGNHDNPATCKTMSSYIRDGFVENDCMFVGGAWSIDQAIRVEGLNWWADEQCSMSRFNSIIDTYAIVRPRVMFTHDCPTEAATEMFLKPGLLFGGNKAKLHKTLTASALQAMYEIHQPDFWFFGHYHNTTEIKLGNTRFHCLAELDYLDFDLKTLEYRLG